METDQYNLRWHYHHSETFLAFESLRRSDSFVDVVLSCEKRSIFAHKLVLSACSNYFFDVLRSVREGQTPVLFFRDTAMDLLEYVVHYIYHGEVEIPSARITDFINLAEALEIKGLKREDGFSADTCTPNPLASAASASYVQKRKYEVYADPADVQHPLAGPVPPSGPQEGEVLYEDPKRLRESNFSPSYVPSRRSSTSSSHLGAKDPHEQSKSEFWVERPAEDYSGSPGASSSQPGPRYSPKDDAEGHRPSQLPPEISPAAPITQVAQVIWRGTDLNNRVLYFCEVCLYKTTKNSNAFAHERRHTQEKPFVCPCGKAYKAPHPLRVHKQSCPIGGPTGPATGTSTSSASEIPDPRSVSPGESPPRPPLATHELPPPPPHPPPASHGVPLLAHQHPVMHHVEHHAHHVPEQQLPVEQREVEHHAAFDQDSRDQCQDLHNYSHEEREHGEGHHPPMAPDYGCPGVLDLKENLR